MEGQDKQGRREAGKVMGTEWGQGWMNKQPLIDTLYSLPTTPMFLLF